MYITSWFMCLFTTLPCWDTVLAICDLIFLEGYQRLFCGALAILEVCSAELLAMDRIEAILPFIQKLPSRLASHQVLIPVLWRTSVTCVELERYRSILLRDNPATVPTGTDFKTPKKRRTASSVASTPVSRSLLGRIITALTPVLHEMYLPPVTQRFKLPLIYLKHLPGGKMRFVWMVTVNATQSVCHPGRERETIWRTLIQNSMSLPLK
ncbi:hypothetical protein GBAR_LOCUS6451 [Geodia barretti]|uniref:Rab-GAP TBC domain-containing protein n=3 Tax=Geodia barretti TaxID=519541 RepID=A0AA35RGF9_GEOBA|nr:hypothetical protein GBAR_LOCUS6451 [Geodia barretti]